MWKSVFSVLGVLLIVASSEAGSGYSGYSYGAVDSEEASRDNSTWPTKMSFAETKTNYMLGEALLKRLYGRMEHTENLIRMEMSQVYDKLRDLIDKSFKMCDRQRRRADAANASSSSFAGSPEKKKKARQKQQVTEATIMRKVKPSPPRKEQRTAPRDMDTTTPKYVYMY